ncbi:M23 family metallopeptidase [Maridesulfovibrio frigidus]|uniref:M23 family metallopeptidase n=1 Tax=Maridesulfovibrio frigidus TaxID=340956 RepID=UPI0004E1EBEA|nr:M23 family metallopeptidase [Maridesulfovibrio frigidus]
MFTRSLRYTLFLLLILIYPTICHASTEDIISINIPKSVGVGQPFLVQISSSEKLDKLDKLEIFWNDKPILPTITTKKGISSAIVILGTSLRTTPADLPLVIQADSSGKTHRLHKTIHIVQHEYQRESLTVAPKMIKPPQKVLNRTKSERELALKVIRTYSPKRMWQLPFALPVKGKMLSRFGLHRVFNGESKRRHKGLDFRAYLGTPIHSIAAGTVTLVGKFYYAGNCVYIDHGNGIISASAHMSKVLVKQGDIVRKGEQIGLSGATGRANGAHLHLGVFVQGVSIDAEPLFKMSES